MPEENVEIVRQVYDAAARHDASRVIDLYDPAVELDATALGLDLGVFVGHPGLRQLFSELRQVWGEINFDYDELIDGGDQVVSVVSRHVQGRASGVPIEGTFALLWTLREGKVVRVVWFRSRTEALEAAGCRSR